MVQDPLIRAVPGKRPQARQESFRVETSWLAVADVSFADMLQAVDVAGKQHGQQSRPCEDAFTGPNPGRHLWHLTCFKCRLWASEVQYSLLGTSVIAQAGHMDECVCGMPAECTLVFPKLKGRVSDSGCRGHVSKKTAVTPIHSPRPPSNLREHTQVHTSKLTAMCQHAPMISSSSWSLYGVQRWATSGLAF